MTVTVTHGGLSLYAGLAGGCRAPVATEPAEGALSEAVIGLLAAVLEAARPYALVRHACVRSRRQQGARHGKLLWPATPGLLSAFPPCRIRSPGQEEQAPL